MSQAYIQSSEEIRTILDSLMSNLHKEDFDNAFSGLKPYWPFPEAEFDKLHQDTIEKIPVAKSRFGKAIGYDYVKTRHIGGFLQRYYYVLRFEKHILRMMFTFYSCDKGWLMNGFTWDDSLDDLWD